ncbi:MFS transporter [Thermoflavimicrobium daqui]|nr:MFS transporter [Thermoflavimicrobium daqui]
MKKNYSFICLWLGQSLANLGDVFLVVSLITLVYHQTHSTLLAALYPIIRTSFMTISGLIAPWMMDRFTLLRLLILAQGGQTVLMVGIVIFLNNSALSIHWIWPLVALISFLDGWTQPTRNSLIPRLVDKGQLVKANSLISTTDSLLQLVHWSVGGLAVAFLGASSVIWVTFIVYIISTFSLFFIRDPYHTVNTPIKETSQWVALKEGWQTVFSHIYLKRLAIGEFFLTLAGGIWSGALLLTFVTKVLKENEYWWGFINSSYFAGCLVGGAFILSFAKWIEKHLIPVILWGALIFSLLTIAFATTPIALFSIIFIFLSGPPYEALYNARTTLIQTSTSPLQLPKVFSAFTTLNTISFGLSTFLMSMLADLLDIRLVYIIAAFFSMIPAILLFPIRHQKPSPVEQSS